MVNVEQTIIDFATIPPQFLHRELPKEQSVKVIARGMENARVPSRTGQLDLSRSPVRFSAKLY